MQRILPDVIKYLFNYFYLGEEVEKNLEYAKSKTVARSSNHNNKVSVQREIRPTTLWAYGNLLEKSVNNSVRGRDWCGGTSTAAGYLRSISTEVEYANIQTDAHAHARTAIL